MFYIENKFRPAIITEDILIIKPSIEISTIITVLVSIFILTSNIKL